MEGLNSNKYIPRTLLNSTIYLQYTKKDNKIYIHKHKMWMYTYMYIYMYVYIKKITKETCTPTHNIIGY
jgi:hypothetical protein